MRYSRQREQIYRCVAERNAHPSAAMVYADLKEVIPRLSLGTVYRNLNQLSDAGRLKKIPLPDGSCRFDGTLSVHSHIVCTRCGVVADVWPVHMENLRDRVYQETGFTLDSCEIVMHGTCESCNHPNDQKENEEELQNGTQGLKD